MVHDNSHLVSGVEPSFHRTKVAVRAVATAQLTGSSDQTTISNGEFDVLLASLMRTSSSFTTKVKDQVNSRAQSLFGTSTPSTQQKIKAVLAHRDFGRTKGNILKDIGAMERIDQALASDVPEIRLFCTGFPMKVFNPLETNYQGDVVDLGDVSVLLRFAELAEVLTYFGAAIGKRFSVVIVADGRMNLGMFKVDPEICDSYVAKLNAMIDRLNISSFVSVQEFFSLLALDKDRSEEYEYVTKKMKAECHAKFDHLLNQEDLSRSIERALELERNDYQGDSFEHLFNSTIGSVRYREIERLSKKFDLSFLRTYSVILESILWSRDATDTASRSGLLTGLHESMRASFLEELSREYSGTIREAWHSTIEYFAVQEINRMTNILNALFPDGIRITTRPKEGQIGVHTSDQNCPTLFSYHSVPVILPCNKGKNVKIDFQLRSDILMSGYRPVMLDETGIVYYEHPSISCMSIEQLPWKRGTK
jgi:hypothetical protein